MDVFQNLDLLSVAVAIAAMGVLGFAVLLQNPRSKTNRCFFYLAIAIILWSIANYAAYQFQSAFITLWLLRLVMFFAVWFAFMVFAFLYTFPSENRKFPNWFKLGFAPLAIIISIISLTPLVFREVVEFSSTNGASKVANGPGIILFGLTVLTFNFGGVISLFRKTLKARRGERLPFQYVLGGIFITLTLIVVFNFLLPAFFDNPRFIPLGALFIFPFVAFTAYAILKHKLFNIRVAGTAVLVFLLAVVTFLEVILAKDFNLILYRGSIFILVLTFGIMLIRTVLREVEQRERLQVLTEELGVANEKLRALDRAKTEFVSIGSHQLRAPLTAIKGYASMLLEGSFGALDEKVKGAIDVIFQSSNKLVRVIEDFLNITRIELGTMKYETKPFDLKPVVEAIIGELKPNIEQKGLRISFSAEPRQDYTVIGDSGKLGQVINNLIDNALKYTEQGSIAVELKRVNGKTRFIVSDTGVGIAAEVMPKLFEKFIRANGAGEVNITGTGLGLYVAKQIVEDHGGKIWAESEGAGKGSRFVVEM